MPPKRPSLQKSRPTLITNKASLPKKSGTYIISENQGGTSRPIYVGQSTNIRRRIGEHLYGQESAIDRRIQRTGKDRLKVQCITGKNARYQEQSQIDKIRMATGRRPPCNKINGISK